MIWYLSPTRNGGDKELYRQRSLFLSKYGIPHGLSLSFLDYSIYQDCFRHVSIPNRNGEDKIESYFQQHNNLDYVEQTVGSFFNNHWRSRCSFGQFLRVLHVELKILTSQDAIAFAKLLCLAISTGTHLQEFFLELIAFDNQAILQIPSSRHFDISTFAMRVHVGPPPLTNIHSNI